MNKIQALSRRLRNGAPTILSCVAAAGVIATAVTAVRATPKALYLIDDKTKIKGDELTISEKIIAVAPVYIPSVLIGVSTITCIFGANVLNKKKQAALTSAYALLNNYHKEYRNKLIELHGEEADEEIRSEIVRTNCDYHQIGIDTPDDKMLFYDEISKQSFVRYEREVMDAEYHLNRNFVMRGYAPLNEFYEFLGLPKTDYGETVGWSACDGYSWIDFQHRLIPGKDGQPDVYAIDMIFCPDEGYLEGWE